MKRITKRSILISLVCVVAFSCIAAAYYLFIYDRKKDKWYIPQMDYVFMQNQLRTLALPDEYTYGEAQLSNGDFEGLLLYNCSVSSAEEIHAYFRENFWNSYEGTYYTFPTDIYSSENTLEYEAFVGEARYTPIVQAWGHGWMHYDGNLYEKRYGEEAAKDKPNYRNYFTFTLRKNDAMYDFSVYCNNDDLELAFAEAIRYFNTYKYN